MEVVFEKDKKDQNPLLERSKGLIERIKQSKLSNSFYYFLILLAIGIGFYMIMFVDNNFSLAYGGDYSSQYIPMGYHIWDYYHEWIYTGHFTLFDPELYLGANSIGSNAYYGLFSPFNIVIVIFPRSFVPSAVALASLVKLACAGLFFSIYMKQAFKVKESVSFICGIAYAFCGFSAFYLWYNNYQDILVFFPLVLLGIEKTIQEKKPWILAIGVFFLAICNYVLMVSYIICAFFYAMFRFFQTMRSRDVKNNFVVLGLGVAGFAGGLFMSSFVFGPALMATLSSPKLETNSYGDLLKTYLTNKDFTNFFKTLFSWNKVADQHNYVIPERVLYPILEFFFPPTTCRSLPMLQISSWDFDDMAVSLWCYIPFIMFLVPALIQSGKEKKWSHYIGFALLLLSIFTPFMYFLTMGFSNGYARWTLFIVSSLIAYVGIYIDKIPNVARWHIHVGFVFAIVGIVVSWILAYYIKGDVVFRLTNGELVETERTFIIRLKDSNGAEFINIAYIIELAYTLGVYLTLFFLCNKKAFTILMTVFVAAESIAVGNFVSLGHGGDTRHNNGYATNERFKKIVDKIEKEDKSYYRMYTSIGDGYSSNNSFVNGYNSVSFFHSLYNFEVNDFTMWMGLRSGVKSVSGTYRGKYQDLDNLLGIKYYIISKQKSKYADIEKNNPGGYIANVPHDFKERKTLETDEYLVYENPTLSQFGYSYSTIFTGDLNVLNNNKEPITRYYVNTVKNAAILSSQAHVSETDLEEIKETYGDVQTLSELPVCNTITTMLTPRDYNIAYYPTTYVAKKYNFADIPNIPETLEKSAYNSEKAMFYFTFLTPPVENTPLLTEGTTFYVKAGFYNNLKFDFYFIDKDNNIFMYDMHDDDTTDNTCYIRGFYIKRDVYKIALCGKYGASRTDNLSFYKEEVAKYEARREALNANPITDVTYKKDRFTFKTNYENNMFVVSRVAYDQGWKIKATNNETKKSTNIKVYKGNGGFISFVAPKGNYSYAMTYETPYLKISYILSAFSFEGFFLSMLAYQLMQEKKRRHHLDEVFREN